MRPIDADALKSLIIRRREEAKTLTGIDMVMVIDDAPTVDAAPVVHGRWIYENDDPSMIPCSMCGYQVFRYNNTPYCPNCGAKMDLVE